MTRHGLVLGGLALLASQGARAEPVPEALQGRWGMPKDCAVPGAGLTIKADSFSIVDRGQTITVTVDASEVHDGQARLTIRSVSGAPPGAPGPKPGDSIVLKRTGAELRPLEGVTGGTRRDMGNEPPVGLCT